MYVYFGWISLFIVTFLRSATHGLRITECQALAIRCITVFCTGCSDFVFVSVVVVSTVNAINDDDVDLSRHNMEIWNMYGVRGMIDDGMLCICSIQRSYGKRNYCYTGRQAGIGNVNLTTATGLFISTYICVIKLNCAPSHTHSHFH